MFSLRQKEKGTEAAAAVGIRRTFKSAKYFNSKTAIPFTVNHLFVFTI